MKNIIITENQLRLITEALGVPEFILESAEKIYELIAQDLKSITTKESEYTFFNNVDIELGDKNKIGVSDFELLVSVEEYASQIKGKPVITSMGMSQSFLFDREIMMKKIVKSTIAEIEITYGVGENWEPSDLYDVFISDKSEHLGSIAHELKHKYDKQSKKTDLVGRDVEYNAIQRHGSFGIPVIDGKFMRFLYYTTMAENLVRSTEVASELRTNNVTKSEFRDFLNNNRVFTELVEIKNFTFYDIIKGMYKDMDRVDELIKYIGEDPSKLTDNEKIEKVFQIVYVHLGNTKMDMFLDMTNDPKDNIYNEFVKMFNMDVNPDSELGKVKQIQKKFLNHVSKYETNPTQFFKDEVEKFNYIATKMIKKIGKLYAMAKDDVGVNESIINWDLHQKLMEKKHGKMKIETKFKYNP